MSRHLLATLLAVLALLASATGVLADAELASASPAQDATVEGSPPELVATFTQTLDPDRSSIRVVDAGGAEVASGGAPGDAPTEWHVPLPELAPGRYEVQWTAWSAEDNHGNRGTYAFTVTAAPTQAPTPAPTPTAEPSASAAPTPSPTASPTPTPSPTPAPTPEPDPAADGDTGVAVAIIAALLAVVAVGAWLLRRRPA